MTDCQAKAEKYDRALEKNKERQRRWYALNKDRVNERNREARALYKNAHNPTTPPAPVDEEPEPLPVPAPQGPVYKFSKLTETQITKEKPNNNHPQKKQIGLDALIAHLKSSNEKENTQKTYKTLFKHLYELADADTTKTLPIYNAEWMLHKIDQFKKPDGGDYGLSKKLALVQALCILSNSDRGYGLDVPDKVRLLYEKKLKEIQITSRDVQAGKQDRTAPPFSEILKKALDKFGAKDKFYVFLRCYLTAPNRDNFDNMLIIKSLKEAQPKKNYLLMPMAKKGEAQILIRDYKTMGKYGDLVYPMDEATKQIVKTYMADNGLKHGDNLFGATKLSKYIGPKLDEIGYNDREDGNINFLRHSIATEFFNQDEFPTDEERLNFSERMGHSPTMNQLYQRKISQL